jgi:upstream activation factor subunit UAF30
MATKKKRHEPTPVFLSRKVVANEYGLTKNDRKVVKAIRRKPRGAFWKPITPDATLAAVVGPNGVSRAEMTKKVWAYIKRNGLQDNKNKRMINSDARLRSVFGGKGQVSMFEMTKLVNKHVK